jgi:hypothetical protein
MSEFRILKLKTVLPACHYSGSRIAERAQDPVALE